MKKLIIPLIIIIIFIIGFFIYQKIFIPSNSVSDMEITSVFANNEKIPFEYTCDGENSSPSLEINNIPENTQTLALIIDDPDAPAKTWVHWVVWNIPVSGQTLTINKDENPGTQGITDFGDLGYGGPCPPSGTHRYFFKVYALDSQLDLQEGATKQQLEQAMQGYIIEQAQLIGLYSRQ